MIRFAPGRRLEIELFNATAAVDTSAEPVVRFKEPRSFPELTNVTVPVGAAFPVCPVTVAVTMTWAVGEVVVAVEVSVVVDGSLALFAARMTT